jgi:hypothetical protein
MCVLRRTRWDNPNSVERGEIQRPTEVEQGQTQVAQQ